MLKTRFAAAVTLAKLLAIGSGLGEVASKPLAARLCRRFARNPPRPESHLVMSIIAINVRNQFRGIVKEVIDGPVVSEVDIETASGLLVTSVITTRSVKDLGLVVGSEVIALVKATDVSLAKL